jgi:pimeloyl-ACP methyl ester carboxylesterase
MVAVVTAAEPPLPHARAEQTRARQPDETGIVVRDGVRIAWERYGSGEPTILLLPTWSIVHSRFWKGQIPYLARHFRVVTFDGRGNGRSDRPAGAPAYAATQFVADALAVLDATGTDRAIVAGLSRGGAYLLMLAGDHPERVLGAVYIGPALPLADPEPAEEVVPFDVDLGRDEGRARYNAFSWRRDWRGFAEYFFGEVFSEAHSTKQIEDTVGWALETDPETIVATVLADSIETMRDGERLTGRAATLALADRARCPSIVLHGTDDRIIPFEVGQRLATALRAPLVSMIGSGHDPAGREPVLVNRHIRRFVESVASGRRRG